MIGTMKLFRPALALCLGLLALSACGSDDEASPAEDWYKRYAHALCAGIAPCCAQNGQAHEVKACEQLYGYLGSIAVSQAMDKGAHYDKALGDECLTQLSTWFDSCSTGREPDVCGKVISGKGGPGAACDFDFDCAQPDVGVEKCVYSSSTDKGSCILSLPPEEGAPCNNSSDATTEYECGSYGDSDYYCDGTNDICKKKGAVGAPCEGYDSCVDSAYCDQQSKQCAARIAVGGDCSSGSSNCADDAYCDGATCQARKAAGEACTGSECLGYCDTATSTCTGIGGSGGFLCVTSS